MDTISHSKIWSSSAIFVVEDDSQDGADHVDAHRIPVAVISPHVERGAIVHRRYDLVSVLRSMELIMGMKALSLNDALATPMYDAFTSRPLTAAPFDAIPAEVDLLTRNAPSGAVGCALQSAAARGGRRRPAGAAGRHPLEVGPRSEQHAAAGGTERRKGPVGRSRRLPRGLSCGSLKAGLSRHSRRRPAARHNCCACCENGFTGAVGPDGRYVWSSITSWRRPAESSVRRGAAPSVRQEATPPTKSVARATTAPFRAVALRAAVSCAIESTRDARTAHADALPRGWSRAAERTIAMTVCPSCGAENPSGFKFCGHCAAPLPEQCADVEERRAVTTLFCDLVGFTAMSERADPEDIDALLSEYSARARRAIESHGGVVEKFIGDAVVGVFGVPAQHEDDPERGVRAALRLLESLDGLTRPDGRRLEARCGVNSGEVLVRLDVDPASGRRFLAGDAVNVAARLQAAAPPGGVAVGALTRELTSRVIVYEELPPVVAGGKAEPVLAWRALAAVARPGVDVSARDQAPLVGREAELAYLTAMFDKATGQSTPQFALIVGEPGIGKSRLVGELLGVVESRPELTTWRQGYCPPFGEDTTYRALAEIVRNHAGIRDGDDAAAIGSRLEAVLPVGDDRQWLAQRLRVLLGQEAPPASREENFTAWTRFFEEVAAARPMVLVFEDLHWADDALLAFLEHLATHLAAVPLLIVGTARPELFERRPAFAATGRVNRIALEALSAGETARLVAGLLLESGEEAGLVAQVVERCDGNPFFAEQSVRLLADAAAEAVPGSVQAVLAARLDALDAQDKAVLGDAAVIGETFWDGALAALAGGGAATLGARLAGLEERRFVRRMRISSFAGQRELRFVHALARDVAYARLPRARRASGHAAVATWLDAVAGARREELADTIAYHCLTALELARAAGRAELADPLAVRAVEYLTLAGDHAMRLDAAAAEHQFARALELLPTDDRARLPLLVRRGQALAELTDYSLAAEVLGEAAAASRAAGHVRLAATALCWRGYVLNALGGPVGGRALVAEALDLLRDDDPSPELVFALERLAYFYVVSDDLTGALGLVERALTTAAQLGLPEPVYALHIRGLTRCYLGDPKGLEDVRRALAIAQERGSSFEVATIRFNLVCALWLIEGAEAAVAARRETVALTERRGHEDLARMSARVGLAMDLVWAGEWDEAMAISRQLEATLTDMPFLVTVRCDRALLCAWRGEGPSARETVVWLDGHDRAGAEPQALAWAAFTRAVVRDALGDVAGVREALEAYERAQAGNDEDDALRLPVAVRLALAGGDLPLAGRFAAQVTSSLPLFRHALAGAGAAIAEARGEAEAAAAGFAAAAAAWHDFGVPFEEAQALLGQGRCLVALGRASEAAAPLAAAREIFARLGARPALAETDERMQRASSA